METKSSIRLALVFNFAKEPVTDELHYMALFNFTFSFETGNSHQRVTAQAVIPPNVNVKAISVTPHMHLLGKQIGLQATLPNGKKQCLLNVPNWDFRWQGFLYI